MRVTTNSTTPMGGMDGAQDQVEHHHHAELHRVDAVAHRRRHQDRDEDQHGCQSLHEAAYQQHQPHWPSAGTQAGC
jgi:hypothetical protein